MKIKITKQFYFDNFKLDAASHSLYFENVLIKNISRKALQVLLVLLEKPKQVVSNEVIIERVWGDNYNGITSNNIAQYILKLRKILAEYQPQKTFIDTKHGYIFLEDVKVEDVAEEINQPKISDSKSTEDESSAIILPADNTSSEKPTVQIKNNYPVKLLIALSVLVLAAAAIISINYFSTTEEEKIRQLIEDSQKYESLVLYENPAAFNENELKNYWIDEPNISDLDVVKVKSGVKSLIQKGNYYGKESKCERFDFISVEINEKKDFAVAKTIEKWFVAIYRMDNTLLENKTIGPYSIVYNLRKQNGKWLIERSSTARATK